MKSVGEAELGVAVEQGAGLFGEQSAVALGESTQRVPAGDECVDPFVELLLDLVERGDELLLTGV